MSRESSVSNLDYNAEFREKSSSSSQPRLSSTKTSSLKITNNRRTNHDVLENPKKSYTSPEASRISLRSERNTEDGSPVNHERPLSILTLNPSLSTKPETQQQDEKPVTNVPVVASQKKKTQTFRPKECKWYSSSNSKYGDYKECTNYVRYGYCRFGAKCRYEHPDVDQFSVISEPLTEAIDLELSSNDQTTITEKKNNKRGPCWFFKRTGSCFKGDSCEFTHIIRVTQTIKAESIENPTSSNDEDKSDRKDNPSNEEHKLCRNFLRYGRCRFGNSCKFSHIPKDFSQRTSSVEIKQEATLKAPEIFSFENSTKLLEFVEQKEISGNDKKKDDLGTATRKNFINPSKPSLYLADLSDEDIKNLCKDEVLWVKKKFQKRIINESGNTFEVYFYPSDPDWPFEVKYIVLRIEITDDYPKEICLVQCLNKDEVLPVILLRHINKAMKDWLNSKFEATKKLKKVELLLRPFCKWLDRNLQDVFIEGLKKVKKDLEAQAAGIEFVPCEDILESSQRNFENLNEENSEALLESEFNQNEDTENQAKVTSTEPVKAKNDFPSFTPKRGTEIKLRNLELTDHAGTLSCRKLALTVQCGRCRFRSDIITPPHRINQIICSRCHHNQRATFRPQLLHQFLAVLGYLDLEECSVIDIPLSKCNFSVGCLNCNRQVDTEGLQFGQKQNIWCLYCNSKMGLRIESVKFQYLQLVPIISGSSQIVKLGKNVKKVHDPAIQEGKPLPENGTCKHYKKSFRWLRFPCCGKAYPCDFCHDEKETDHEMKRANRMICGYCAKEQPYTNGKDCISCLSSVTKRTGTHWEGGKGCRDKIKMSREDKQKYQGVTKTMSKKAQLSK